MATKEKKTCSTSQRFELWGANGSPYSVKMRAYLRFKRLPFLWKSMNKVGKEATRGDSGGPGSWPARFNHIRPKVIPVLVFPDGRSKNDSTFLIKEVEAKKYAHNRPALPTDPVLAFITLLLEDFADEWLTKVMYGMRWNRKYDIEWSGLTLANDAMGGIVSHNSVKTVAAFVAKTQAGRTAIVGCPDSTIHRTFHEVCKILEQHFKKHRFILGSIPTIADFAFYGQMSQWIIDRTPAEILPLRYPSVFAWLWRMDDTSGVDIPTNQTDCWIDLFASSGLSKGVVELLKFIGSTYLPFLKANNEAIHTGKKKVTVNIFEGELIHKQKAFKYQQKCYDRLHDEIRKLNESDKNRLKGILQGVNCWTYLMSNKSKL